MTKEEFLELMGKGSKDENKELIAAIEKVFDEKEKELEHSNEEDEIIEQSDEKFNFIDAFIDGLSDENVEALSEILEHHGIDGQKWGVRNGPPYPLDRQKNKKSSIQDKAKQVLKDADDLTLDELKLLAQKIEWEKKLSDVAFEKKNTSNTFAKEILKSAGQTIVSVAVPIATKYIIKQVFEKAIGDNVEVIVPGMPKKKS